MTCLATVPTDLVKVLMQGDRAKPVSLYNTPMDCLKDIYQRRGFLGFYRYEFVYV